MKASGPGVVLSLPAGPLSGFDAPSTVAAPVNSLLLRTVLGRRLAGFVLLALAGGAVTSFVPAPALGSARLSCGRWTVVATPNPGPLGNTLAGVTSVSATDAWAVGSSFTGSVYRTIAERWDGTAWSEVATPNVGSRTNALTSVVASSSNDAWAVGFYDDGSTFRALAMHWDGFSWSLVHTPNVGAGENVLESVSAVAVGDVWAVGYRQDSFETPRQTLAMHWTGGAWSVVSTPNGTGDNYLWSVAGRTAADVWAVGSFSAPWFQTLTMHWDGGSWTQVPSPNLGDGNNVLYAAAPLSAARAVAVGTWLDADTTDTLAQVWNGRRWKAVPSQSPAGYLNFLTGLADGGPAGVWAVGWGSPAPFAATRTLTEHWDGDGWTVARTPNVGSDSNQLAAVAHVTNTASFWAVGHYEEGGVDRTLALFRC